MEVYEIIKPIGSGTSGQVYLAKHKLEGKCYVIKKVKTRDMDEKEVDNTEREVKLLQKLRHPNIVGYKDSFVDREQFINIVMENCDGGELYTKSKNNNGKNFSEEQILEWFAQMALAIHYLHERRILHRDLKSQNIFLKNSKVKVGDFGISKVLDDTKDFANTIIGTPYYMAPEIFQSKPYKYKSDIWALGCILYELCNLKYAFNAQSINGLAVKVMKGSYAPINTMYSKELRDLIGKMLSNRQNARPNIIQVVQSGILKRKIFEIASQFFDGNPPNYLSYDVEESSVEEFKDQLERLEIRLHSKVETPLAEKEKPSSRKHTSIPKKRPVKKKAFEELNEAIDEKSKIEEKIKKLKEDKQKTIHNYKQKVKQKKVSAKKKSKKPPLPKKEVKASEPKKEEPKKEKEDAKKEKEEAKKEEAKKEEGRIGSKKEFLKVFNGKVTKNRKNSFEEQPHEEPIIEKQERKHNQSSEEGRDTKDKVLAEKEKRKEQERFKREMELKAIMMKNIEERKKASEKQFAQYRPSSGMIKVFNQVDSEKDIPMLKKLQEDYSMEEDPDELEEIQEEIESDSDEDTKEEKKKILNIDNQMEELHNKLLTSTIKIETLKKNLKSDNTAENVNAEDVMEILEDNSEEEDEEKNGGVPLVEETSKVVSRIKMLKHRCEAGLGGLLFEKAFNLVLSCKEKAKIRSELVTLLGEENIGYWAVIDQIIFLQDNFVSS